MLSVGIVTGNGSDQTERIPCVSFATTLTWYVPAVVQVFVPVIVAPLLTGPSHPDVVPSPQSNMYETLSPSGSVVDEV